MGDYPAGMTLRPIERWPLGFTPTRKRSPFSATLGTTLSQLDVELRHLGQGRRAPSVLQIAMREQDFRLTDGMPRASARPEHPGVILAIESKHGPLSYPCDTFTHWQDNLRAITLGLEALRRVERYGITQTGQQYRGWQALTAAPTEPPLTAKAIVEHLARLADMPPPSSTEGIAVALRKAKHAAHPDRNDGDHTEWNRVAKFADQLEREGFL